MAVEYIKWQDSAGNWNEFDLADINCMPQAHALHLFDQDRVKVVAKEGNEFFVSTPELAEVYRRKGNRVTTFRNLLNVSQCLGRYFEAVGFRVADR